jgi:hypothetical protein
MSIFSTQVRHCCAEALAFAENVVHPRLPVVGIKTNSYNAGDTLATSSHSNAGSADFSFFNSGSGFSQFNSKSSAINESGSSLTLFGNTLDTDAHNFNRAVETSLHAIDSTETSTAREAPSTVLYNIASSGDKGSLSAGTSSPAVSEQLVLTCSPARKAYRSEDNTVHVSLANLVRDHSSDSSAASPIDQSISVLTTSERVHVPVDCDVRNIDIMSPQRAGTQLCAERQPTSLKRSRDSDVESGESEIEVCV